MSNDVSTDISEKNKNSLQEAFSLFQAQCERLEASHRDLKKRLDEAELSLAEKNEELAQRVDEVECMRERLEGTLESIQDAILLIDSEGIVRLKNQKAEELFQEDPDNKNVADAVPVLNRLLAEVDSVEDREEKLPSGNEERTVLISVVPMERTESAKGTRVVSIKDITEYRRLQERVEREDRLAALGQVAASVAHEIRNPLGGIEGFARLLQRDLQQNEHGGKLAEKIIYASRQLNQVVSNLLGYTREIKCDGEPQDLNPLIHEVGDLIRPMIEDKQVELEYNLDQNGATAWFDAGLLRQVLTNFLTNAVEACPIRDNGKVEVQTYTDDDWTFMLIKDNGCGIEESTIQRIFDPFFTAKDGGIGLGLALCRRIIDLHKGDIKADSVLERGTTFTVQLPKACGNND